MHFDLEPFGTAPKETSDLAAPDGCKPPTPAAEGPAPSIPGVADENGTALSNAPVNGSPKLPGSLQAADPK